MPRRGDRVAPPPRPGEWDLRFDNNGAARGWKEVCRQVPSNARTAWELLAAQPRRHVGRQHRLRGSGGSAPVDGVKMEQWQYEVTGSGRIWYCIDDERRTLWWTWVGLGHPKMTE